MSWCEALFDTTILLQFYRYIINSRINIGEIMVPGVGVELIEPFKITRKSASTFVFNSPSRSPKVRSNGGQAPLSVLYSDKEMLILVHTSLDPEVSGGAAEMYTVFRNEGVVTHSTQKDSTLIGPFGVIEMGYCN